MATAGDGSAPYENAGAGGKFRKRPFRRSTPATPYARPPTAVRNNKPSMLKKLVDPASRLISAGAHRLFDVFRKSLLPLSLGPPEINEEPQNVLHKEGGNGNSASISDATGISELELMLQQKTFSRSEIERLTSLLHSKTTESPSDDSLEKLGDKRDNFHASISTPVVNSRVVAEEIASPAELTKHYMGSRPTSQATRPDSNLFPRTPITPMVQKTSNSLKNLENGLVTPRSRGRSAMYTMARTPYSRSPSTFSQQLIKSDYGHGASLTSSQGHERKMALKRRSSVLDDDIGSGGPLRRIRQKANLLSQRDKKELGDPVFQQSPDYAGQKLLLTNEPEPKVPNYASVPTKSTQTADKILQHLDKPSPNEKGSVSTLGGMREKSPNKLSLDMLHGQALRSLDKVDSPKFLTNFQKPELTLQSKDKTEESGSRKSSVSHNLVNGDMRTDYSLKGKSPITELPSKVTEEPQKKHAFQMSAPDDFFEMDDDDDDDIHDNGHASLPLVESNKPETSAADIIKTTPALLEVSKEPELVEYKKPEVSKVEERVELKKGENNISDFGSVSQQGLGFKIPESSPVVTTKQTSESSQPTLQMEKISPVKVSPFSFSANVTSQIKPNAGSDPKEIESTSLLNSATKNDDVKFSVSNKDANGKSESIFSAAVTPTKGNGIFSFGTSINNTTPPPSLPPFSSSATTTATTATAPAAIFSASVSPQAFTFGSATSTPTTSVAETGNTSTISPFAAATTGSGLFGCSSPAAATSTITTATGSGPFGFSSTAAVTSTTTGSGLFSFGSPAATSTTTAAAASGLSGFSSPSAAASTTANTTTAASGLFGFSSSAAIATSTTTIPTTGSGLFGFSSAAAPTSTAPATGSGLFGFSSPAAATSTTANTTTTASGLFGFSSPAAAAASSTTTTTTASGLFGFSSPAAATTSSPFGFSSPAAPTSTTTGNGLFGFSDPAAASTTATTGSGLFSFGSSAAAATTSAPASQSQGSFFNISNGFQATTNASSTTALFGSSTPAFGSSSSFGVGSTPDTKSGSGPTTSIFGSTWQQPQTSSGFGSTFTSSPSSSTFTFGASPTPASSFATANASNSSVFGSSTPVFGATSPINSNNNNNNDQMEDNMAEDSMQTQSPVSPFGQSPVGAPGFMFGAPAPTPGVPFSFGGQGNQGAAPGQNPFQSSSVEFNAGGGSFSLGSTGGEKSNRRIVRVMKSKNRKK